MNGGNSGKARIAKQSLQDCRRPGVWGPLLPKAFSLEEAPPLAAGFFTRLKGMSSNELMPF